MFYVFPFKPQYNVLRTVSFVFGSFSASTQTETAPCKRLQAVVRHRPISQDYARGIEL